MSKLIYLDNHASTKCDPRVVEAMLPYFSDKYGNASSIHDIGLEASDAIELARKQVAQLIEGAKPDNIYFTSSATEANNIVIFGVREYFSNSYKHQWYRPVYITSAIEHMSILKCFDNMHPYEYGIASVDKDGLVNIFEMQSACDKLLMFNHPSKLCLVSVMMANNEIGTMQPIREIKKFCDRHGSLFHTDAVQSAGRFRLNVDDADIITLSSHKMYGPKGVGAIYVSDKAKEMIRPRIHGGYQEAFTSGTSNVPAIVGFGKAAELMLQEGEAESIRLCLLRDMFLHKLKSQINDIVVNGSINSRLPHNLNISIPGIEAEALINIDGLCISTGSACKNTGTIKVSHVISAIKADVNSIRFGFGRFNTEEDINIAADKIINLVKQLRSEAK